jgi:hypothetical protein
MQLRCYIVLEYDLCTAHGVHVTVELADFFSEEDAVLLEHLVGVLSAHIGDDSPSVRSLCVKGLVQVDCSHFVSQIFE